MRGSVLFVAVALASAFLSAVPAPAHSQPATAQESLEEARSFNQEVVRLYEQGRYDAALPFAQRALAIQEKVLGPEHPNVAMSLNDLALLYRAKGDYARADPARHRRCDLDGPR